MVFEVRQFRGGGRMKKTNIRVINSCLVLAIMLQLLAFSTNKVNAEEAKSVETESSVIFTGVYEPIGQPEPPPPEGSEPIEKPPVVSRPGNRLPQTNDLQNPGYIILGIIFLLIVGIRYLKKMPTKYKSLLITRNH